MPTHSEATRLNLEYYRKQSKALLKAAQSGDPAALERLHHTTSPKLSDAQFAIAREQGFASWPKFRAFIVQSGLDFQQLAALFIDAATSDLRRADELLSAHPEVANAGFYAALVLGDTRRVAEELKAAPSRAVGRSGPQNCEPLIYVCFSRYANGNSSRAAELTETARILLSHGADPNTAFTPEDLPDNPLSCLYAASGLNNNPALTQLLLEAGAHTDDNESLYHSSEHPDLVCFKLLLRFGAKAAGTNTLKHMLDRDDLEGVQLLLAAGADPNETNDEKETALHWAVMRGRSAAIVQTLLDAGAEVNVRRKDGRTAYALAAQSGQAAVAELLQARGASTEVPPLTSEGSERLVSEFAMSHHTEGVRRLLDAGLPVNARGPSGATALHWSCWKGYADLVELLLARGASLTIEDEEFHGTPPGWFGHGVKNYCQHDGDYPRVARLLIAAGAAIPKVDLPTGNREVDEVLRASGLI